MFLKIQKHLINMPDKPVELFPADIICFQLIHRIRHLCSGTVHQNIPGKLPVASPGRYLDEIFQFPLVGRKIIRPAITVVEHLCYDVRKRHVPPFQREKRLIHLRINPYRTSLA